MSTFNEKRSNHELWLNFYQDVKDFFEIFVMHCYNGQSSYSINEIVSDLGMYFMTNTRHHIIDIDQMLKEAYRDALKDCLQKNSHDSKFIQFAKPAFDNIASKC